MFRRSEKENNKALRTFLQSTKAALGPKQRLQIEVIQKQYTKVFDLKSKDGQINYQRLIQMAFQDHNHQSTRIKMLILIHYAMVRNEDYCERLQESLKFQFKTSNIKPRNNSILKIKTNNFIESSLKITKRIWTSNGIEDNGYIDLNQYLHLNLTLPYYQYLLKLSIHAQFYYSCRKKSSISENSSYLEAFNVGWKIINIIRGAVAMKKAFTHIGRYHLQNCLFDLYGELENIIGGRVQQYEDMSKLELQNLIAITEQISKLNQELFVLFYNRYYCTMIDDVEPEQWLSFDHELVESIHSWYSKKYKGEKTKRKMKQIQQDSVANIMQYIDLQKTTKGQI